MSMTSSEVEKAMLADARRRAHEEARLRSIHPSEIDLYMIRDAKEREREEARTRSVGRWRKR